MNRHLIWIVAGTAALGLGVPAFAASRSDGTPDDNGVPGDVRGNCDEAEHANDPGCLSAPIIVPDPTMVTVPSTSPATLPVDSVPLNKAPSNSIPGNSVPSPAAPDNTAPDNSVPGTSVASSGVVDVSGPCDEAEHVNDPRCTGAGIDDVDLDDDDADVDDDDADVDDDDADVDDDDADVDDDDRSGHGDGRDHDDRSGHGGGDDD